MRKDESQNTTEIVSISAAATFTGSIVGQIIFGYIGDSFGRRAGLVTTISLTILGVSIGAAIPALTKWTMALSRFVLGLGIGGVYPLSATCAAECGPGKDKRHRVIRTFAFQGLGFVLSPLMTLVVTNLSLQNDLQWRILLLLGALPGLLVLKPAIYMLESHEFLDSQTATKHDGMLSILRDSVYRKCLIGTSLSWFFFDVSFYGNAVFTPTILEIVYGFDRNDLQDVALYSLVIALIALPGYFVAIQLSDTLSLRSAQLQGFACISILFAVMGGAYSKLLRVEKLLFALYALTFFFSNFGPAVTTFALPSEIFPVAVRAKCNGFSAALGKLGAVVGASSFGPIRDKFGTESMLFLSAIAAVLGFLVTWKYVHLPTTSIKTVPISSFK